MNDGVFVPTALIYQACFVSVRYLMGAAAWTFAVETGQVNNIEETNNLGNLIMSWFCVLVAWGQGGI